MKFMVILCIFMFIWGCTSKSNNSPNATFLKNYDLHDTCKENYDNLLRRYADNFSPKNIDLSKTLDHSLDSFLLHVDTHCLRLQKEYQYFITEILAKLFYYHILNGHQSYDLQSMDEGGAKVIIHEFKIMAGYDTVHLEMLSSGVVVDFIQQNKVLSTNPRLKKLLKQIKIEADLIDKQHNVQLHP